jgi:hypothetical protein
MIQIKKLIPPAPTGSRWQVPDAGRRSTEQPGADQMVRTVIKPLKK